MTENAIPKMIKQLEEIGWLAHLSPRKKKKLKRDLQEWHERKREWTYLGLAAADYDEEMIEDDFDYAMLLRTYRSASNRVFEAKDIVSQLDHENSTAFIGFTLKGQRFETELSMELGDYVAEEFLPFVNDSLRKVGIEQQFYFLPPIDQFAHIVFVPPSVYAKAEEAGLVPKPPRHELRPQEDDDFAALEAKFQKLKEDPRTVKRMAGLIWVPLPEESWIRWAPLTVDPRRYLIATVLGVVVVLVTSLLSVSPLLIASVGLVVAFFLLVLFFLAAHPVVTLAAYQALTYASMITLTSALLEYIRAGHIRRTLLVSGLWLFFVWTGARVTKTKTKKKL